MQWEDDGTRLLLRSGVGSNCNGCKKFVGWLVVAMDAKTSLLSDGPVLQLLKAIWGNDYLVPKNRA